MSSVLRQKLFPEDYQHHICQFESLEGKNCNISLKVRIHTEEEVRIWLQAFQKSSQTTWRVNKSYPAERQRQNMYRVSGPKMPTQHAEFILKKKCILPCCDVCRSQEAKLFKEQKVQVRSKNIFATPKNRLAVLSADVHINEGLCLYITLKHTHHHLLMCAEAMRYRDVAPETSNKLQTLFESGHSPSSALTTLKYDLQEEMAADRSICPDLSFCFRLYCNIFKRSYGELSGDAMLSSLQASLDAYNKKEGAECGKMSADSKNVIIVFCTPLMRRVHSMVPESAEIVFVDSSGNCDRTNSRVFLILTHSAIGGLPLGVMMTSSESQSVITAGLQDCSSSRAFFRRTHFFAEGSSVHKW
ncbi:hypothetical protein N1851_012993 [Merluccius polli]|uniref:Uncharacterized protein n=1 Tax=Merluccius polli TaxID=89951 RepID=A0AA47MWQ5_MERPO|nr:hypothetical protein N1851_012993 [Merluccius polli]